MRIEEVNRTVIGFLKEILNKEGTIIKTGKTAEGWEAWVEVIEVSEYIKALGIPTTVRDRNLYEIKLDHNLEVLSYERIGQQVAAKKTA
jgi:hypothetical protein